MRCNNHAGRATVFMVLIFLLGSCAGQNAKQEYVPEYSPPATQQTEYVLGAGDVIRIEFFYSPNMNRQVTVRPDGRITLPLKGEIKAAGLTPVELKDNIISLFSDVLKDPEVTVAVEGLSKTNMVYVLGEVQKPDYYLMEAPTTLTQILARAGVMTNTANLDTVLVVSRNDEGKPVGKLVNVSKILSEANLNYDVLLNKHDIVFVSKTTIAQADLFVEQYINRLIPSLFRVGYGINRTTTVSD